MNKVEIEQAFVYYVPLHERLDEVFNKFTIRASGLATH